MTSPLPVADPVALPILEALLGCLEDQVARVADPPSVISLRPGIRVELLVSQNHDECCSGLAWVRCVQIYPSSQEFPAQDEGVVKCFTGWAVVVELGVARCAPRPKATEIPTAEEWAEVTAAIMADAAALRRALMVFKTLPEFRYTMTVPGAWDPMTVEGGCVGGSMTVTVHAPACDTLED